MKLYVRFLNVLGLIIIFFFGTISIVGTGGGNGGSSDSETKKSTETFSIESDSVGIKYNISVGIPPLYNETGTPHAAIFLLDGDNFFSEFYESYDEDDDIILIGINNTHRRNIDYLPVNTCETHSGPVCLRPGCPIHHRPRGSRPTLEAPFPRSPGARSPNIVPPRSTPTLEAAIP